MSDRKVAPEQHCMTVSKRADRIFLRKSTRTTSPPGPLLGAAAHSKERSDVLVTSSVFSSIRIGDRRTSTNKKIVTPILPLYQSSIVQPIPQESSLLIPPLHRLLGRRPVGAVVIWIPRPR